MASYLPPDLQVVSFDYRGHGQTKTDNESDMSIERLVEDAEKVLCQVNKQGRNVILLGHSLGGSIAARLAAKPTCRNVLGMIMIDITEGAALNSLVKMKAILSGRPASFGNSAEAITWCLSTHMTSNRKAAQISFVDRLVQSNPAVGTLTWRTDLFATEAHWSGWFAGLNRIFLSLQCSKMLILAGVDALDRDLLIAQMQGKFQYEAIRDSGHCVQEDQPEKLAQLVETFIRRLLTVTVGPSHAAK